MDKPLVGLSLHHCLSLEFLLMILLLVWSLVTPHSLFISIQAVSSTLNSQTPQTWLAVSSYIYSKWGELP